jgi:hypothetical protein
MLSACFIFQQRVSFSHPYLLCHLSNQNGLVTEADETKLVTDSDGMNLELGEDVRFCILFIIVARSTISPITYLLCTSLTAMLPLSHTHSTVE